MERNTFLLRHVRFGSADVHAAIDLHRIGIDDLAIPALGEFDGGLGLAGRCRADKYDRNSSSGPFLLRIHCNLPSESASTVSIAQSSRRPFSLQEERGCYGGRTLLSTRTVPQYSTTLFDSQVDVGPLRSASRRAVTHES